MPRPIAAFIHPNAVKHNLDIVRTRVSHSRVWAVVKANAYGHGIERIYSALGSADGIALLDLDEAVRVRDLGWNKPIMLLEGIFKPADVGIVEAFELTVAVHCHEQLDLLETSRPARPININLKMNSGMNRLGFLPEQFRSAWDRARAMSAIGQITLMTHFANADEGEADWQIDRCRWWSVSALFGRHRISASRQRANNPASGSSKCAVSDMTTMRVAA